MQDNNYIVNSNNHGSQFISTIVMARTCSRKCFCLFYFLSHLCVFVLCHSVREWSLFLVRVGACNHVFVCYDCTRSCSTSNV